MVIRIHVLCNRFPTPYVYSHQTKSVHFFKNKKKKCKRIEKRIHKYELIGSNP
uniref:RE40268p n=1 Tax=Drosophila melanogaster TaxID=7227 RepID=Q8SX36_DROME|nr:RE40268p [Drosophila melanogaster]